MDRDVRRFGINVWAAAAGSAEAVSDGVFDAQAGELGVGDDVRAPGDVDRERAADIEPVRPVDCLRLRVEAAGVGDFKLRQRQQDAARQPRPQAGAVGVDPGASCANAAAAFGDVL